MVIFCRARKWWKWKFGLACIYGIRGNVNIELYEFLTMYFVTIFAYEIYRWKGMLLFSKCTLQTWWPFENTYFLQFSVGHLWDKTRVFKEIIPFYKITCQDSIVAIWQNWVFSSFKKLFYEPYLSPYRQTFLLQIS